ncbi:toxin TcdB middle/N-terminal domain-containing protein [Prevotella histicola]|nr:toxin TcdB middle/N-terminal domain-containing protein [Prevotella histicola]
MKTKHYLISAALLTAITAAIAATHIYKGQDGARENNGTSILQETAQTETFTSNTHNTVKAAQGNSQAIRRGNTKTVTASRAATYAADHPSGIIGQPDGRVSDNPEDNLFEITLAKVPSNSRVWLVYDLKGVSSASGVSKSINDRPGVGGYLTALSKEWKTVREEISPSWVKAGKNTILFTLPSDASYSYSVRNVRIETSPLEKTQESIVFSEHPTAYGSLVYVHGFIRGKADGITISGQKITVRNGEFEGVVPVSTGRLSLTASVSGKSVNKTLSVARNSKADFSRAFVSVGTVVGKQFLAHQSDSLVIAGNTLSVTKGEISKTGKYTITALRETDIPALDYGMTNVTARDEGYRFLPHGEHFAGKGATVKIKYDRTRIPSGFTEDDINTYYFDKETKHWVALERVKVDKASACVVSKTTHFTDMINGVIKAPESPQTDGFTPTMMNDIKAADPTSKINLITPPTANNRGSANLQYAFEMPPARNGMAPSLGIQYSSEGGSGWLGEGWNLSVPSITLDTRWGVPRYDTSKETETYLMSGSMLSTMGDDGKMGVAHRGEKMNRKADRQFYTRQGGDFSRIIRKGNSPADYTWEVTDKQGIKYIYGGEGAVLKGTITDASGQSREVITEWKLKRVEETHGDYIEYVYETADEPVRGGLVAKAIYLKEVRAGNCGQAPHTVVVLEGSKQKRLKNNNARYGFLTSSNRLLEKLTVHFQGSTLRSYAFTYGEGAFNKDVLTGVKQLDDKGAEVSYQNFDYYDDVQAAKGYVPFKNSREKWDTHNDRLDAGFLNPITAVGGRFSDKPTALGGSLSSSIGGSFYAGVGLGDGSATTSNTAGASFSYSNDKSSGLSTFADINGDGAPDKVYKKDGAIYYRPQQRSVDGAVIYGEPIRVRGISNFSKSSSNSYSGGADVKAGWQKIVATLGTDLSKTSSKTTVYFSDINGDGLVDLVSDGKVYFNHIEFDASGNAIPTFTLSSADTPSPIIYDNSKLDTSVGAVTPEEQAEVIANSPMEDMVRVWQAPAAGIVNISGEVRLLKPTGDFDQSEYDKADGVRVAIQKGGTELWQKMIAKGDETGYPATASNITVQKGDKIYFRVQSGNTETSNGAFDNVTWSPEVIYQGLTSGIQPNGYTSNVYKATEGAVYTSEGEIGVNAKDITFSGKFVKPSTTDELTIRIIAANNKTDEQGNSNPNYGKRTVFERTFAPKESFNGDITASYQVADGFDNLSCEVVASSNVDWASLSWKPIATYRDSVGSPINVNLGVRYSTYSDTKSLPAAYTSTQGTSLTVTPTVQLSSNNVSGKVTLTAKTATSLISKKEYSIVNGLIFGEPMQITSAPSEKLWFEFFYSETLDGVNVTLSTVSVVPSSSPVATKVNAGFYAKMQDKGFGDLYRGWGGFVYNAADGRYAKPIDESLLKLPKSEKDRLDPMKMVFTPLGTDLNTLSRWTGQRTEIYLTATEAGTARLTEQDVVLGNLFGEMANDNTVSGDCLQGTGAFAITQKTTSTSTVIQTGVSMLTVNNATGSSTTKSTMMDFNGDGYPDILAGGIIQYTNTQGGISGEKTDIGTIKSSNLSQTWSLGSIPVASFSITIPHAKNSKSNNNNLKSSLEGKASVSLSLGTPNNEDWSEESFIDINGDGLVDRVYQNGDVRLNFGYTFSKPIKWDFDKIQGGNATTFSTGGGFSIGSGSYSGGIGLTTSENKEKYNLTDLNSDGLPDRVWIEGNGLLEDYTVRVAFNNGSSFDQPIVWKSAKSLSNASSTSESVNTSFTTPVTIPVVNVKIAVNPGVSLSHSINRPTYALQDVDGDGYLDIVESDKESELKVTRSAIGRTNMLKSVTNSLGGTFTLDYEHSTPTYGLPGGKWVMSSVTIDDGIRDDGPMMKTMFAYSDGQKDRHEREFLGFGKVVTKNIDTEQGESAVYRQAVQLYDVSTYYAQGNELSASVEDAKGNKYTETRNEYDGYYITANGDSYTFNKQKKLCSDRASAFVPLRYTANKQYEGQASGITTSEAWNEYYLTGHHGELKSYKFSDKGKLGADGSGKFDYQTAIQYAHNDNKHIFGLPTNVTVTGGDGKTYHQVSATYDLNYADHITQIKQQLGSGEAVSDYTYDAYGNIIKTTLPANSKGQRMWYTYRYEPVMNMYVERIDDAFGYRSEAANFDYRYGMALRRMDLNHFYYETEIDNLGRVKAVRGPNELATGVPYIIAFDYQPKATFGTNGIIVPAYAVTKHYDIQHPSDDMETVTFVDGFGRPVQVKKDGVVTKAAKGSAPKDETVMIVSGRNVYDAFGRVAKAYYPVTEAVGNKTTFNKAFDNVSPTVTVYDVLDRAMKVTLPDNAETKTEYSTDAGSNALVTTVTDALGNRQATYTNGSGKTVKTEQLSGPDGIITTSFEYDGIDRLVKVTDTEGNVTTSVYDMGDRRTEVNHPASGITTFTYDNLGNVLTKQTANLKKEGKTINYEYDYGRLTAINYPDHPENNVKYHYGGINSSHNRIGRLMLREDGSGAIEYYYGKMGEVLKTVRTLIVPNQAVATYVTQWKYDSHNRLLEMIYPDEEKVTYGYNLGGQVDHVRGYKSYGYDYVNKIGYDKFEQRTYLKYCNGAETFYSYDPARRRLQNLVVNAKAGTIMDNAYSYDAVSNVLGIKNNAPLPQSGKAGGQMSHSYTYDPLYRLASATGTYKGTDNKSASYTLSMGYDNMHRITSKKQHLSQTGVQFEGTLNAGYDLTYTYQKADGKKFQLDNVRDINYRTEETPTDSTNINNGHKYTYDANGNLVYINTSRVKKDGKEDEKATEQKYRWDEENRLLAADENGFVSNYWYDADGERTVKTSGENEAIYVNSEFSGGNTGTARFSLYVSPYLVAGQGGKYTKHIYVGSQRIVSKLGDLASYGADPRRIPYAGYEADGLTINYKDKYNQQLQSIKDNYKAFDQPYNGKDNDDYVNGQGFCCNDGTPEAAQARAMARTRVANDNFHDKDNYEKMQFYYHPDHLGSSSYITNLDGEVAQHIEYVPFGEVFIEERNNTWNTPYLFNAKEFDEETGMYYYGARYYEPKLSLWMSVDPFAEKARDISPYVYCNQNPIIMFDPDGKKAWIVIWATQSSDATGRMRIGHTGVVVENYKLNVNTNGVKRYEPTGTYTYYDLWPLSANLGGKAAVEDVEAIYKSQSFYITTNGKKNTTHSALERYMSRHDMSQIPRMLQYNVMETSDESYGEGYAPDGIIRLNITAEQTYNLQQEYVSLIQQGKPYNGESNNCTTFVANGINNSGVGSIKEESITDWRGILVNLNPFHKSFTPNSTYNQLQVSPNSVVVKSADNKTRESYEDAIIDH